jgi:predicted secreted protein
MLTLEDQIEIYTDKNFNPSHSAQHFFASYGEAEIAKKRTDMTKLQQQIENVLKQNVRSKYTDFLVATEQINQVGQEMTDLKHLIDNTQKLLEVSLWD